MRGTVADYGREMQLRQIEKYRARDHNSWGARVELANRLFDTHVAPTLDPRPARILDVGCSIGTFAIEFAKRGHETYGIDFDPVGIELARELAAEEGVSPTFMVADVVDWEGPSVDLAVCFDIFEHLHDDDLGVLLHNLRATLNPGGVVMYHTFPQEYDYLFEGVAQLARTPRRLLKALSWSMLMPLVWLPPRPYERTVRAAAGVTELVLGAAYGKTYRELIETDPHCNPTTDARLRAIFARHGYDMLETGTSPLYRRPGRRGQLLRKHPISHRSLFGIARVMPRAA